jgi:hypothetical protein
VKLLCNKCHHVVDAVHDEAAGAVRCPRCQTLAYLPGHASHPTTPAGGHRENRLGLGWLGYALIALVMIATGIAHVLYAGHAQQWVLIRTLPAPAKDAIKLIDFYCTNSLPSGGTNSPVTLGERKEKSGKEYLVVEISVDADTAGVRRLTEVEIQEIKQRNPGFSMSEVWLCLPADHWFRVVGPGHTLRSACAHREAHGSFSRSGVWNLSPASNKPQRIDFTICFEVDQRLAESEKLAFQFKWHRPLLRAKSNLSPKSQNQQPKPTP